MRETVVTILTIALATILCWMIYSMWTMPKTEEPEWLGWIQFSGPYTGIDPGFYIGGAPPTEYYRMDIEIGLREDGVVVWRKVIKEN